jgi:hypothetical protein
MWDLILQLLGGAKKAETSVHGPQAMGFMDMLSGVGMGDKQPVAAAEPTPTEGGSGLFDLISNLNSAGLQKRQQDRMRVQQMMQQPMDTGFFNLMH